MLLVRRMAWSTKLHHMCVVVFMVVNLFVTYEDETVGRALVVYAIFSTFACAHPPHLPLLWSLAVLASSACLSCMHGTYRNSVHT